jgi:hypothetical protein
VVSSSANTRQVLDVTGLAQVRGSRRRRHHRAVRAPAWKAGAGHVPGRGRPARGRTGPGRGVRGRHLRGRGRAGRPVPLRGGRGPDRPRRRATRARAPTSWSPIWPSCWRRCSTDGLPHAVPGRAVGGPGDVPRPRPAGPGRVGVRAVQRAPGAARQPGRGRAARDPGHLPRLVLRATPAAVRGGRLRLSRVRPDRSSTSPTAS